MASLAPSIDVVIPAYNAAGFIRETLASIAGQTLRPTGVTVVDDRSTDATAAIVEAAARDLAPGLSIRLMRNQGPRGPSAARNTAIRASTAEWIALCDADDLMLPHHLATLAAIAAAPGTVIAFGDCSLFDSDSDATVLASHHAKARLAELPAQPAVGGGRCLTDAFAGLLRGPRIPTSACLLRGEAVLAAGLFDEAMMFAEDADLFLRLAWLGQVVFTEAAVARKRVHAENLSRESNRVHFARGGAVVALKLLAIAGAAAPSPFRVTAADRALCAQVARGAIWSYLYDASRAGPRHYAAALRLAWQGGFASQALSPRHLARMLAHASRRLLNAGKGDR